MMILEVISVLINEVAKSCNITKKAVRYYVEQECIIPNVLENGYMDFSERDVKVLKQIVLYRKLGLSISEIKKVYKNQKELKGILYQRTLELEQEKLKQDLLKRVEAGEPIENLEYEMYKNSEAYRLMEYMKQFCSSSGYYDVFIPTMRKLSPLYYEQMLKANEQFVKLYPEYLE